MNIERAQYTVMCDRILLQSPESRRHSRSRTAEYQWNTTALHTPPADFQTGSTSIPTLSFFLMDLELNPYRKNSHPYFLPGQLIQLQWSSSGYELCKWRYSALTERIILNSRSRPHASYGLPLARISKAIDLTSLSIVLLNLTVPCTHQWPSSSLEQYY
ncbi:hypothetical protein PM082_000529 [Marasmius tenuissimus]|nr:hypothetical protein PM082_000529 [Marasmius tenuissimus]